MDIVSERIRAGSRAGFLVGTTTPACETLSPRVPSTQKTGPAAPRFPGVAGSLLADHMGGGFVLTALRWGNNPSDPESNTVEGNRLPQTPRPARTVTVGTCARDSPALTDGSAVSPFPIYFHGPLTDVNMCFKVRITNYQCG